MSEIEKSSRTLRQEECIDKWVKNKCRGSAVMATGFGKTRVGLIAIQRFQFKNPTAKIIIIVPSDPIKNQWLQELQTNELTAEVLTMQFAAKYQYKCALLIIDECHRILAPTLSACLTNVKHKAILCLTATFERLDGRHEILEQYAPVFDQVTTNEAIEKGWLNEYREYLVLLEPDDIGEYQRWNREFTTHFAWFNFNFTDAMSCATDYKYRLGYAKKHGNGDETYNKQVLYHAKCFRTALQERKKYINDHPDKIKYTNMILEHRQNKKCITFSSTIKMAEKIGYGKVYSGKDSAKKGRITLEEFVNQDAGVVNSIMKLDAGFNDPSISVAVILGMNSSQIKKTQRVGRCIRAQKGKVVEIFNLVIKGTVEQQWFKNSTTNKDYITLDEAGLIAMLEEKEYMPKQNKQTDMLFRF